MTRREVIDELWHRKIGQQRSAYIRDEKRLPTHAYCEITEPLMLHKWDGKSWDDGTPVYTHCSVPAGATLKIVMISRLGDVGLTDDLAAKYDYHIRIPWDSLIITNLRLTL